MTVDDADLALIHRLADVAGDAIRPHFRALTTVETKADASPVTVADRAAEAAIRGLLRAERPGDGIVGEEFPDENGAAARVWVIDPIDGTRAFVAGRPLFGTLIALLVDDAPVLGLIDQCIARDRWLGAAGRPTMLNGAAVCTRSRPLAEALLATTSPDLFGPDRPAFERVRGRVRETIYGGDCHNYGLVAAGHVDLVIESGLKLHDWAALVPVVAGAGGAMTDWAGAPLRRGGDGRVVAAGDAALAVAAVAALAGR